MNASNAFATRSVSVKNRLWPALHDRSLADTGTPRFGSEISVSALPSPQGIIGCVGFGSNDTNNVKYAQKFDYYFTGLDGRACKTESISISAFRNGF